MNSFKKVLSLILVGCFVFTFAACKGNSGGKNEVKDFSSLKVGIIYTDDYTKSLNYAYAFDKGLIKTCEELKIADTQIVRKNVNKDYDKAIKECIDDGCNVVITTDMAINNALKSENADALKDFVQNNKKVTFLTYGYTAYALDNQSSFYAKIYEASYISGIAAGLKTKSNAVAYIPTLGNTDSLSTSMVDAFAVGVNSVNSEAKVFASPLNTNMDLILETSKADALIKNEKCDVLAHSLYTELAPNAAEKAGVPYISYNGIGVSDSSKSAMFSVNVDWSVFFTLEFNNIVANKFSKEHKMLGLADGVVAVSTPSENNCDKDLTSAVNTAIEKVKKGDIKIFENNVYDAQGRVLVPASGEKSYSDSDLITSFNLYNFNITVVA